MIAQTLRPGTQVFIKNDGLIQSFDPVSDPEINLWGVARVTVVRTLPSRNANLQRVDVLLK